MDNVIELSFLYSTEKIPIDNMTQLRQNAIAKWVSETWRIAPSVGVNNKPDTSGVRGIEGSGGNFGKEINWFNIETIIAVQRMFIESSELKHFEQYI